MARPVRFSVTLGLAFLCGCGASRESASPTPSPHSGSTASPVASRSTAAPPPKPPRTWPRVGPRTEAVVDDALGLTIPDPYRWMEQPNDAELSAWMRSEGDHTRRALDANPGRAKLFARIRETGLAVAQVDDIQIAGEQLVYLKIDKGGDLKKLVLRAANGKERTLVDPSAIPEEEGQHWSIDHFAVSPDGKRVAYGLARGGGEIASEHVIDTATGHLHDEVIPHIWGEFAVSWFQDSKGFYYTQIPATAFADPAADKLQNMSVLAHVLAAPVSSDVVVLGPGTNPRAPVAAREFPFVAITPGSPWALGFMSGAHQESRVSVSPIAEVAKGTAWQPLSDYSDEVVQVAIKGDVIFLTSKKGAANGRVLRVSAKSPKLEEAAVVLAESDATVESLSAAADALYVSLQKDGRSILRRIPYSGGHVEDLGLPFSGWVDSVQSDVRRPGVILSIETWTREETYYAFDPRTRAFAELRLAPKSEVDFSQIVTEETTVSNGGVEVPLTILHRRDIVLDGSHPTVVFGYGAYGNAMSPAFRPVLLPWLERGGVWAIAHVRGGGEKGETWRKGAWRETKANGWRDFNACAEWLVRARYTSKGKLAAYSASAGGILVGRAITERPDLYTAAMIHAGIVNTTRYMHGSNGANQSFELGPDDTREGMATLLAMDAYQNVKDGAAYPGVLVSTGLNDLRVSPWMSAKLAARMRAATSSERPVLLRVEGDEGDGVGSRREQRLAFWADMFTFFLEQTGDPAFALPPLR